MSGTTPAVTRLVLAFVVVQLMSGCSLWTRPWSDDSESALTPTGLPDRPAGTALRVLVIGDHGTGDDGQRELASAIARTHADAPPDLALTVGDNFYPDGVESADDPLWTSAFGDVYDGEFWGSFTFHPSLGNHDHEGDPQAQIEYSDIDPRWSMPDRWYTFRRSLPGGGSARFVALDTDALLEDDPTAEAHRSWIDSVAGLADADWVVVYGHHPLLSGGLHDPEERVVRALLPSLRGRVPLYLAGHNHTTELLRVDDRLTQGICGGGGGRDNPFRVRVLRETRAAFSNGGWCMLHVARETLTVELYNRVGTLMHREVLQRRDDESPDGPVAQPTARLVPGDTVLATPRGRYDAGPMVRWVMGDGHRELWPLPVEAPVLDLETYAGGLTPLRLGGGQQTTSLRFRGADGHLYTFRSIDKEGARVLDPLLRRSLAADVLEDRISALMPLSAMVVAELLDAGGILHPNPELVVLPDDPALGEFRERLAGMLGWIEEHPDEVDDGEPGFAASSRVVGSDRLLERLEERYDNRVDARNYLRARLVDALVGDWDRHPGQWRWAGFENEEGHFVFEAVPEDRDWALTRLDGMTAVFTGSIWPHYVTFDGDYPSAFRASWSARVLDRRILPLLSWQEWEAEVSSLTDALTDSVIRRAVGTLPAKYRARIGEELTRNLTSRRDDLRRFAREHYELLAGWVDLDTTDEDELARIERLPGGGLWVEVFRLEDGQPSAEPRFRRHFDPELTREVRIDLHGGDDRIEVTGAEASPIRLRIEGGGSDDHYRVEGSGDRVHLYDHRGDNTFRVPGAVEIDRTDWDDPVDPSEDTHGAGYRSWGERWIPLPAFAVEPDNGLVVGMGARWTRYGFREYPYRARVETSVGIATGTGRPRLEVTADLPFPIDGLRSRVGLLASGAEFDRYYGLGNETPSEGPRERFRARRQEYAVEASVGWSPHADTRLETGLLVRTLLPDTEAGTLVAEERPYGFEDFTLVGLRTAFDLDRRDDPSAPRHGYRLHLEGRWMPDLGDVRSAYAAVSGHAATYLSVEDHALEPSLALRIGGEHRWGEVPFFDAAYLGGPETLRGFRTQRFGGRSAAFASLEGRVRLSDFVFLLPGEIGLLAHGDAGRVFVRGESSDRVHTAVGGGAWVRFVNAWTAHVTLARGADETLFYVGLGLPF